MGRRRGEGKRARSKDPEPAGAALLGRRRQHLPTRARPRATRPRRPPPLSVAAGKRGWEKDEGRSAGGSERARRTLLSAPPRQRRRLGAGSGARAQQPAGAWRRGLPGEVVVSWLEPRDGRLGRGARGGGALEDRLERPGEARPGTGARSGLRWGGQRAEPPRPGRGARRETRLQPEKPATARTWDFSCSGHAWGLCAVSPRERLWEWLAWTREHQCSDPVRVGAARLRQSR
ncbi:hypothetical protein P7K49_012390 [Saguinus oedipus]|uniref:Uncharacterized protein n=1 Tax=Saguinus oedipus TaxID=9490 RepID=A0ABQ9VVQ9_SAGOE|nr:hypothetical protein P7K49_012390 [Saguinus oedipus]